MRLQLRLQPLEQRERVGRGPGEPADRRAARERADLFHVRLDDLRPAGHLPVRHDADGVALADAEDGGGAGGGGGERDGGGGEGGGGRGGCLERFDEERF